MSLKSRTRVIVTLVTALAIAASTLVFAAPANAVLGGVLSGTVTHQVIPESLGDPTSAPLSGVYVSFAPLSGTGSIATGAFTDALGNYSTQLPVGSYRVQFIPPAASVFERLWFGGSPYEVGSEVVAVGASAIPNVSIELPIGTSISGNVTISSPVTNTAAAAAFLYNFVTGEFERSSFRVVTDTAGNYTIAGLSAGSYLLRFGAVYDDFLLSTQYWNDSDYLFESDELVVTAGVPVTGKNGSLGEGGIYVERLAGADRFSTSVAISQQGFGSTADSVFIVNGLNFPDALSAGPAAGLLGAPVLLVQPNSIPAVVAAELTRLNPLEIYIIGGTATVSSSVETQLQSYAPDVERVSGTNRFETSRKVALRFFGQRETNRTAYLATGSNFPDALGSGPAAANERGPVILMDGSASSVDSATRTLLIDLGITKAVIAGGPNSFSTSLEQSLAALPVMVEVYRRSGANRFDTAVKVNQNSFTVSDSVFLATGASFPDALAGAALAGRSDWHNPIYLVQSGCVPIDVLSEIARLKPQDIYLLGGPAVLGAGVENFVPCS